MPTGKTKDAGWQIGVSKTIDHPIDQVWDLVSSPRGLALWLGKGVTLDGAPGEPYETDDATVGEVRSHHPHDRIRLTWQPPSWDHDTTVQVALSANGDQTLIRFHQERLANADEREQQRAHWKQAMVALIEALSRPVSEG